MAGLGRIFLHPIDKTGRLAVLTNEQKESREITYVFPSGELVTRYRPEISSSSIKVSTMDQMVKRIAGDHGVRMSPYFRYKCIEQCMNDGVAEGWFAEWRDVSAESFAWVVKVEQWVGEMKRAGVTPARLRGLLSPDSKLNQALVTLYERYQMKLKQYEWLDQEEAYAQSMTQLKGMNLAGQIFIFEQFYDLHYIQENLLADLLLHQAEVELHLIYDQERSCFQSVKPMLQRLQKVGFSIIDLSEILRTNEITMQPSPTTALQHVKQTLFTSKRRIRAFAESDQSVKMWKENNKVLEVRRSIRQVKEWMLKEAIPGDQIALVTSQWDVYAPLVRRIASEAGVPFDLSLKCTGVEQSMGQVIRSVFACKDGDASTIPYLSRWAGIELTKWDGLRDPWRKLYVTSEEILQCWKDATNSVDHEQVIDLWRWIQQIPESNREQEWFTWFLPWAIPRLRPMLQVFHDDATLQNWMEDQRLWGEIERWIQEMSKRENLGGLLWTAKEFADEMTNWLSSVQILVESGERGGARLIHANMIRGQPFTKVILLGCEEGSWPVVYQDDWLCPDRLRLQLHNEYIWLLTSQELQERQMLPFFMTVMSAQEQIVFSYSTQGQSGEPQNISSYVSEVLRCFPDKQLEEEKSLRTSMLSSSRWISSKDVAYATVKKSIETLDDRINQSLEQLVTWGIWESETSLDLKDGICIARSRSMQISSPWFGQVIHQQPSALSNILAQKVWSASELEVLMSCRFRYLAEKIWQVSRDEQQGRGLSRMEAGNILHDSLFALYTWMKEQGGDWEMFKAQRSQIEDLYEKISQEVYKKYPIVVAEIEKRKEKRKFLKFWELELKGRDGEMNQHPLQPMFLELSFGLKIDAPEKVDPQSKREPVTVSLKKNLAIRVKGKMDRVDSDGEHVVVYDYKSGSGQPSKKELYDGKVIQLPLYLWVLQDGFGYTDEQIIGGAIYNHKNRTVGLWKSDLMHSKANISKRVKGLDQQQWSEVHSRIKQILAEQIQAVQSGDVEVKPTWSCPTFCSARGFCRYQDQQVEQGEVMS